MSIDFVERHQDYVVGPAQMPKFASIAAGQSLIAIPFKFDSDAPFVLRSIAVRVQYNSSRQQPGLQFLKFRYTNGEGLNYLQQQTIPATVWMAYGGQGGNPKPVYPPVPYPASGVIYFDVENTGPDAITNLTIYLRGVKLYPAGAVAAYTYPADFATNPFAYQLGSPDPVTGQIAIQNLAISGPPLVSQKFAIKPDADFVLRGIQAGLPGQNTNFEVFLLLRDEQEKGYANAPVHIDVLAGQFGQSASFACGSSFLGPVGTGPSNPGLFYPEIYVPRLHILYYDVYRNDMGIAGAAVVNYPITLIGSKVWAK